MVNVPVIEIREWETTKNPSGIRISDDTNTLEASGFLGKRGTAAGETLIYQPLNTTISGQVSDTKLLVGHVETWGDASGISNLSFYMGALEHFDAGNYRFLYQFQTHWASGLQLNELDADLPTSQPGVQNVFSTLGSGILKNTGYYDETQVTQYIYVATFIDSDVPVGTYGGPGTGGFRYRLLFDFS